MLRILVADDHPIIRHGIKQILSDSREMAVRGEASNGEEVLEQLSRNEYDIVLLDISMPGRSGLDIMKEIKSRCPNIGVLILSIYPEEQFAIRALKAGAGGYLTKESAPDELITAIRKVSSGKRYISSAMAEQLAARLGNDAERPLHDKLSDREYKVMCMIAAGKKVREIAEDLSLSGKTISTYRTRILQNSD